MNFVYPRLASAFIKEFGRDIKYIYAFVFFIYFIPTSIRADTMADTLSRAYMHNPDLNQQRVAVRASDEGVSQALSGYRPQFSANANAGYNRIDQNAYGLLTKGSTVPASGGLTATQTLFNGFQTANGVHQAESAVLQARENLRNAEQNTLLSACTAYMNVLRDAAIRDLNKSNLVVLKERLDETVSRFDAGDVTGTDVAQARSSLATAHSNSSAAEASLQGSVAFYEQITGSIPASLDPAPVIDRLLPPSLELAKTTAQAEHPAILAALHAVDVAQSQVRVAQGQLSPTVKLIGNVQDNTQYQGVPGSRLFNGSVIGQISIPIYSGGGEYSQIRQAKEVLGQAQLQSDSVRAGIMTAVSSSWSQFMAATAIMRSAQDASKDAARALEGVREEAKDGQRTTQDVLFAQQTLLTARINLVSAQRDRMVLAYTLLASVGRLSASTLGLHVDRYDPAAHYDHVRDLWAGFR